MRLTLRAFSVFTLALVLSACDQSGKESPAATAQTPLQAPVTTAASEPAAPAGTTDSAKAEAATVPSAAAEVTPPTSGAAVSSAQPAADIKALYNGVPLQVADIADDSYDDGNAIAVTFSVPLDGRRNIQGYFRVQRVFDNRYEPASGAWVLSEDGKTAYFDQVEPDSRYQVSVDSGLPAINGETLHQPTSREVSFGALTASVSFASSGNFLPLNVHTGLPVTVLNSPEANIAFHRVQNDRISSLLNWKQSGQSERYYRLDELAGFSELVHEGRFSFPAERNKRRQINIPVQDIAALQEPGVYVAVMSRPGKYENSLAVTYFMVTDIGMHIHSYGNSLDIYLHSLASPEPVRDADVQLLNSNGQVVYSGKSAADGHLNIRRQTAWGDLLIVRKGASVSIVSMNSPALDLSDYQIAKRPYLATELFIYGPRDIYRPGETAVFSALLRDDDGNPLKSVPLKARLVRPDGQKVKDINWQPQQPGYYELRYPIADDAQTGNWRLEVEGISRANTVYEFKVEDFMPERLKITFNPGVNGTQYFNPQQTVRIPVLGEYLYGAPAAGNRFDAAVNVAQLAHPFEQWPDFYFGDAKDDSNVQQFAEDGLQLDAEGKLMLNFDSRWGEARTPLAVTVTGSLYESGGRPVVRRHSVRVLPAPALVGIRPAFGERAPANSLAEFELIKTDQNGDRLAADKLEVRLINLNRRYHWRYTDSRGWFAETSEREVKALTLQSRIAAGENGKVALPVTYGNYRIEVLDKETGLLSSMEFKAGESWYWFWGDADNSEQGARPDKVVLALDKAGYNAGDVAHLKIVPPAAGETLVMVESDQLLWSTRLSVPAEGATLDIPVSASWARHDIYISALHLQPADNQQRITPTRAIGLLHLPLNREPRRLTVSSDAPAKWTPNQQVMTELHIHGADGEPVKKAWVTLSAVDVGILSLTDFKTPDPHKWFFSPRRYQADMRDMYSRLIRLNSNALAKQRFGGDAELSRGGKKARAEVDIVSLFSGLVEVNNGVARIPLQLPDFNGRLRLMAVAFDDNRFGSMEQEVTLAAPVVTQLSMPRFVAVGDETSVALDVTNLSGEAQQLELNFTLGGPVSLRDNSATHYSVSLSDGQKQTLLLPLRAEYPEGQISIGLTLSAANGYGLSHTWKLNSRMAHPAMTYRKDQILQPGETLNLAASELSNWVPESVETLLSVNNRVNLNPRSQLRDLLHYPYGCLEQSVSSTYPWVYATADKLASLGLQNETKLSRSEALERGMERIAKRQMSHGGYGLWSNHDDYEQHWLTVYAADFLTDAQNEGAKVDQPLLRRTLNRLGEYLRGRANFAERWNERPQVYRQAYQAYAAYVLARHKQASLADIRRLAGELDAELPALSYLHLALAARLQGDNQLSDELMQKHKSTQRPQHYYLGDYGSDVRDTAQSVRLLLQYKLEQSYALQEAQQLADLMKQRRWLSTQERNSIFMAAVQLDNLPSGSWQGELTLESGKQQLQKEGRFSQINRGSAVSAGLSFTNRGSGPLFATLLYQGHSRKPPQPESNGVSISRRYFSVKGEALLPDDGALRMKVGELMLVELTIKADKRRPDLLVADLLPAGLELENQNLSASIKLDEIVIDKQPVPEWLRENRIVHQEYRDDRYVAAIEADSWRNTRLYYIVRAVTPGNYQVPVPLVEDMYDPEIRALGSTPDILTVSQP